MISKETTASEKEKKESANKEFDLFRGIIKNVKSFWVQ